MDDASLAEVRRVFEQWAVYDAIIQNDYMEHPQLIAQLQEQFPAGAGPLRIIDLGCGDSWLASRGFALADVAHYRGIDLSTEAITRARRNLSTWEDRVELIAGDLLQVTQTLPAGSADVVLMSYSLHHFGPEQKRTVLSQATHLLAPGGRLVLIDQIRGEDESREAYLERLATEIEVNWTALTPDQLQISLDHIKASDYPETASWLAETIQSLQLQPVATLLPENPFYSGAVYRQP
ncbi:class I SAM-dependent methyltransferase [Lignipirellula cremea]|uniref:Putative methyltransferase n=1 Tax=Lignipirellula cremea TaxID=2528010 RepID=A0A518DNN8_9BACT|nr:class I SAM-dependent methyltransferase [Lignipirellula cremea]QDU93423.1 putative methyltransferase [Lignipirellula cremea]